MGDCQDNVYTVICSKIGAAKIEKDWNDKLSKFS